MTALHHLDLAALELVSAGDLPEQRVHLVVRRLVRGPEVRAHVLLPAEAVVLPAVQVEYGTLLRVRPTTQTAPISAGG